MNIGEHDAEFLDGPASDGKVRRIPAGTEIVEIMQGDLWAMTRKRYVYKPVKVLYCVEDIIEEDFG